MHFWLFRGGRLHSAHIRPTGRKAVVSEGYWEATAPFVLSCPQRTPSPPHSLSQSSVVVAVGRLTRELLKKKTHQQSTSVLRQRGCSLIGRANVRPLTQMLIWKIRNHNLEKLALLRDTVHSEYRV